MITIDAATTRDRDDGFHLEEAPDGTLQVIVYITNVARAIKKGSRYDVGSDEHRGAYQRLESRYFARGSSPMLPHFLSERKLSLNPGKERHAIAVQVIMNADLDIVGAPSIQTTKVTSQAAVAYAEVPGILADRDHDLNPMLSCAQRLAVRLLDRRRSRGALVLYDLNSGWVTTEEGGLKKLEPDERTIGYVIIQELMILTNEVLASYCAEQGIPILFRTHQARPAAPERGDLQREMEEAFQAGHRGLIQALQRRTHLVMERAIYEAVLRPHFGLNSSAYGHFTSPLRRYVDLVNWWQILARGERPYTQEGLTELACYINTSLQERRESRSQYEKAAANQRARDQIGSRAFLNLPAKQLDRVVKVSIREGPGEAPEGLQAALLALLGQGRVSLLSRLLVLSESSWEPLRVAFTEHLVQHPHDGPSLLTMGSQVLDWPAARISCKEADDGFLAQGKLGDLKTTTIRNPSKKKALQRVSVQLCLLKSGCILPPPPVERVEPPPAQAAVPVPSPESQNPIGALQEFCQKSGAPLPEYRETRSGGVSHLPVFRVHVAALGKEATAEGPSKKKARRAAARTLLALLG